MSHTMPHAVSRSAMMRYIFAGLSASLIAIGLARFAYTPLLPELINQHWFSSADAAYLGAANLAGYLIGALLGRPLAARFSNNHTLRLMMLAVTLSFFACAFPLSVGWYFVWRLVSGISGGAIMVLVAATVLPHVPAGSRNLASGAIFLGIGLGIFASATLVPLLIDLGLRATWYGLGVVSALLTLLGWWNLPKPAPLLHVVPAHSDAAANGNAAPHLSSQKPLWILYAQYSLIAVSIVAPAVFLVDFIARGMALGTHTGALFWGVYGIGSMIGPVLYGYFADRFGAKPTLRMVLLAQMLALFALAYSDHYLLLIGLTVIIGTFPPGIVPLMLARINETVPEPHKQHLGWSRATVFFAAFQAAAGYLLSMVFNLTHGGHRTLFAIGAAALVLALLLEALNRRRGKF
ncbi:YbfB/YjiJ family MFS transporter [Chelonobacter oris]|uniref:YbfB/YjiJ family MFS transporter n=1 Tax=Chelonobacter oris TaxID=505317 RepID=UPI002448DD4E|nr:YbfB/YjiJ family MFS transporter [Chelonobacter oris]